VIPDVLDFFQDICYGGTRQILIQICEHIRKDFLSDRVEMTSLHFGKTGREFETSSAVKQHESESNRPLLQNTPFDSGALKKQSYSTDSQAVQTQIARNPATQYLVINSRDRNQTSSLGSYNRQPWNNFKLQRPQNIMNTYATRMLVSEVNFPWYIPNINVLTRSIWIRYDGILYTLTIDVGFYNGTSIAAVLQTLMAGGVTTGTISPGPIPDLITVTYNSVEGTFNIFATVGEIQIYYKNPGTALVFLNSEISSYFSSASLAQVMGFDFNQVNGFSGDNFTSNPTTCQYTQYLDIVSDKLHQYSTNRDGNSDTFFSRNILCRLYLSDEASNIVQGFEVTGEGGITTSVPIQFIPGVSGTFVIHRQFKNPKAVMWNKEASVDWLDIGVYDQFGNLVPLPYYPPLDPLSGTVNPDPGYPNFQITLLASEN